MSNTKIISMRGSPDAYLAMRLWYDDQTPILEAAQKMGVGPEEVMASFRANRPIRYHLFITKMHLALLSAAILITLRSFLKAIREAVGRSDPWAK